MKPRMIRRPAFQRPAPGHRRRVGAPTGPPRIAGSGVALRLRVSAGRSPERILRLKSGMIRAYVNVPRDRGRANRRVIQLLARILRVRRHDVQVVSGTRSAWKLVRVAGRTREEVERLIPQALPGHFAVKSARPRLPRNRPRGGDATGS